jgi:ubiquinol-cytochrome c reductase cytochrome b subunit
MTTSNSILFYLCNKFITRYPSPGTFTYIWNYGFLAITCLIGQIISGIILAMYYLPDIDLAMTSLEHVNKNVKFG